MVQAWCVHGATLPADSVTKIGRNAGSLELYKLFLALKALVIQSLNDHWSQNSTLFVLSSCQEEYARLAILVNNGTDTLINGLMIAAMLVGFFQIRHLEFISEQGGGKTASAASATSEDGEGHDIVMMVTAFGTFVYATFTVIAGVLSGSEDTHEPRDLVITNGLLELIQVHIIQYGTSGCSNFINANTQVQIQLLFIADLKHKRIKASRSDEASEKPGRQIVTFLLVCNLGLWITYNFEIQKVFSIF